MPRFDKLADTEIDLNGSLDDFLNWLADADLGLDDVEDICDI